MPLSNSFCYRVVILCIFSSKRFYTCVIIVDIFVSLVNKLIILDIFISFILFSIVYFMLPIWRIKLYNVDD